MSLKLEVEATLSNGFGGLRFPRIVEERYESDTRKARCRAHVSAGLVSLVIYNVFLFTDWTMIPDVFDAAAVVRLAVVTPLALLIVWVVSRDPSPFVREATISLMAPMIVASILLLMLISKAPLREYQHTGIVLVMMFPAIAQNIQFRFAVAGLVVCFGLYAGAVLLVPEIPPVVKQSAIMLQLGAAVFMIMASYRIERQSRQFYLFGLRDLLRNEELHAMSKTDPLTGLQNRRALDEALAEMWAAPETEGLPMAVLVLDIDHFKSFNDRYGHLEGDRCIREVARIASGELRSRSDIAVRFGGEELLFVLPGADLSAAADVAERMRAAIELCAMPHEKAGVAGVVTVSIGVASVLPSGFITPDEVLLAADTALYVAKRNGRNQVFPASTSCAAESLVGLDRLPLIVAA